MLKFRPFCDTTHKRILPTSDNLDLHFDNKVALVIGNSLYEKKPLRNPAHDAADMAQVLRTLAFDVQFLQDLKRDDMYEAISEYGKGLYQREVGLFYYAGHGIQVKGKNYLIPINAEAKDKTQVTYQSVELSFLLERLQEAKSRMNIIILDACRDNPYERSFRSGYGRGLAHIDAKTEAPIGTFIAYSTAPGTVAEDGDSRNSPYTEDLINVFRSWDCKSKAFSSECVNRSKIGQMAVRFPGNHLRLLAISTLYRP